jgi:hypothetical protein
MCLIHFGSEVRSQFNLSAYYFFPSHLGERVGIGEISISSAVLSYHSYRWMKNVVVAIGKQFITHSKRETQPTAIAVRFASFSLLVPNVCLNNIQLTSQSHSEKSPQRFTL